MRVAHAGNHIARLAFLSQVFVGSTVLEHVSDKVKREFVSKLATGWLPMTPGGCLSKPKQLAVSNKLLYRGSRDGMTAAAFHANCDGKGRSIVLIAGQSEGQPVSVFGRYAGKSWVNGKYGTCIDSPDTFVFTVQNPSGYGPRKFPVDKTSPYAD
jgi:hypothetical protein